MVHSATLSLCLTLSLSVVAKETAKVESTTIRSDLHRFPSADECYAWVKKADRHLAYIDKHIILFAYDRDDWRRYRDHVEYWRGIWFDLRLCQLQPLREDYLAGMRRIRVAIGDQNYALGYVPPPIAPYMPRWTWEE